MPEDRMKVSPIILFVIGALLFITAFALITLTELGLIEYEVSRLIVYPVIVVLSFLSLVSTILYRKGFVKSIPPEVNRKLLIISMLVIGTATSIAFLSSVL